MTMATLNPEDSAASLFAWAMFETLDGDKSSGLDQVLRKDADFWPAYYELGKLALKNAAFSGLLANMENVIRLNPKCSLAYLYKGYALTKLAHYPEAKAAFAQAAELKNPGASLIMSRLQDNMPDQLFEQYNRPMASLGYFVLYGNMGMAEFADTRLSSSAEHEFGLAMGMGNFLLGFETGNIGAMIKDEKLRTLYSDEINEYGVNMKIQMPIENRFLATLGAGYYLLNNFNSNPESMNDQFNTSVKLTAGGDYFFVRNLAAGFEVGYRIGQLKFSETSYTASGVWDSLRTPVTTTDTVDLSGIYGHVGLKWYTW
jgi:tetratricopeptide (TPR) repeat protein